MQQAVTQVQGPSKARLGRVLMEMGLISDAELGDLLERQRRSGGRLGELLVADKRLTPEQVAKALARRLGVRYLPLVQTPPVAIATLLEPAAAHRYLALPVARDADGVLIVAMADPADLTAIDDLRLLLGEPIRAALAMPESIVSHIGVGDAVEALAADLGAAADRPIPETQDMAVGENDGPVIRFVNSVIARAVAERASDIHIEPNDGELTVRFRVDGILRTTTSLPVSRAPAIVSRLKVMADLDIAERRVPQDGRVAIRAGGRRIDVRVATLPTVGGESVVLRLLDQAGAIVGLDLLGFSRQTVERFEAMTAQPNGLVLVTGPTGSGKTSTMYAALHRLNTPERKILTVEDPVEYRLPGINQIQVRPKAGLTFAAGLRAMLRCDPDVILVGEIRDAETAQIAVEAALTGHLVLATLHTNDSASAVARLIEMGVEPFLIASSLRGVLAQRLVRRLCTSCRRPHDLLPDALARFAVDHDVNLPAVAEPLLFRAHGCPDCSGAGYSARFGVGEALVMNDAVERLTLERASPAEIMRQARLDGMRRMLEDGLEAVLGGTTSLEELTRAVR